MDASQSPASRLPSDRGAGSAATASLGRVCALTLLIATTCHPVDARPAAPAAPQPVVAAPPEPTVMPPPSVDAAPSDATAPPPPVATPVEPDPCAGLALALQTKPPKPRPGPPSVKMPDDAAGFGLSGRAAPLYPISHGRALRPELAACFLHRANAKLRELDESRGASAASGDAFDGPPPAARPRGRPVALASPEFVRCDAAKNEIFTAAKKSPATEFLYPWQPAYPEGARADWSKATECYRSYHEPG
jgi:hypothetical protein